MLSSKTGLNSYWNSLLRRTFQFVRTNGTKDDPFRPECRSMIKAGFHRGFRLFFDVFAVIRDETPLTDRLFPLEQYV